MNAPESLMTFQLAFGQHLRNPEAVPCPADIPPRRAQIYQELLFNNLRSFINTCFPVSKQLLEPEQWTALTRDFFIQWRCHTPYFSEIPREFVTYVASLVSDNDPLPPWLPSLLHYEWLELDVELQLDAKPTLEGERYDDYAPLSNVENSTRGIIKKTVLRANPTLRNVSYEWPVHRISHQFLPTEKELTCLMVYRDQDFRVQFMAINPVTARMIALVETAEYDVNSLLDTVITELQHPNPELVTEFGRQQIEEFIHHGLLMEDQ